VEDVAATTRNARELGAKVMMDKTEVGGFGYMSVIVDPTGAAIALWQPKQAENQKKK
jgi:predicted enzyme related to lactoylglutathione lyase